MLLACRGSLLIRVLLMAWVMAPAHAQPCSYYVANANGSDANAGSSIAPFKTIQRGADAALTAGDIVCVRPGVYFENNQRRPSPKYKGVKIRASGLPGKPIVFQPDPAAMGAVIIDMGFDVSRAPGSTVNPAEALGFYIRAFDYITISGFEIRNVTTGILTQAWKRPAAPNKGMYDPPTHIIIDGNHIHHVRRDQRGSNSDSNIAPVRPNDCYDCVISRNQLHTVSLINKSGVEQFTNQNSAGIHSFGMLRTVIEDNEIYAAYAGIYYKSWTNQPLPGDVNYDPARVPPPVDPATDFGVRVRRNVIHDTVLGVRLSSSGGNGRIISKSGNAHGNPAHFNADISENIFFSTDRGEQGHRLGEKFVRMEWALRTDLRGTVGQSKGLDFYNNTVITHNGVNIDAVAGVNIYNNFFSLSAVNPSGLAGPEIAIRTRYVTFSAQQALNSGMVLNLGTPLSPVPRTSCIGSADPDLLVSPFIATMPMVAAGDADYYCSDNIQWSADLALVDYNYYHQADNFQLNRYGRKKPGIAKSLERNERFGYWARLSAAENVGLSDERPDKHSQQPPLPITAMLEGVVINPNRGVTLEAGFQQDKRRFSSVHPALVGAGRVGGRPGGEAVNIGAFPDGR